MVTHYSQRYVRSSSPKCGSSGTGEGIYTDETTGRGGKDRLAVMLLQDPPVVPTPPAISSPPAPSAAAPPKIQVAGMNFYYGQRRALESITLNVQPNQVTALIGPSGCGKSTFLRSLN